MPLLYPLIPGLFSHIVAYIMFGLDIEITISFDPVLSSICNTFSHVEPPSNVLYIPLFLFLDQKCPKTLTKTISGFSAVSDFWDTLKPKLSLL